MLNPRWRRLNKKQERVLRTIIGYGQFYGKYPEDYEVLKQLEKAGLVSRDSYDTVKFTPTQAGRSLAFMHFPQKNIEENELKEFNSEDYADSYLVNRLDEEGKLRLSKQSVGPAYYDKDGNLTAKEVWYFRTPSINNPVDKGPKSRWSQKELIADALTRHPQWAKILHDHPDAYLVRKKRKGGYYNDVLIYNENPNTKNYIYTDVHDWQSIKKEHPEAIVRSRRISGGIERFALWGKGKKKGFAVISFLKPRSNPDKEWYEKEYARILDRLEQALDEHDDITAWKLGHQLKNIEEQMVNDDDLPVWDKFDEWYQPIQDRINIDIDPKIERNYGSPDIEYRHAEGYDWPYIPTPEGYATGHEGNIGASEAYWATQRLREEQQKPGHGFRNNPSYDNLRDTITYDIENSYYNRLIDRHEIADKLKRNVRDSYLNKEIDRREYAKLLGRLNQWEILPKSRMNPSEKIKMIVVSIGFILGLIFIFRRE